MAGISAYGEMTIVDMTDTRKLSAYITSNQPSVVIYDPNSATKYTPDWSTNELVLTPVIFLDNEQQSLTGTGISISWKRQTGSDVESNLITGESVSNGILTVSNNMLSSINSGLLTYICEVVYTDPDTTAKTSMKVHFSFSLVKNATELKDVVLTGDQTFKYNGEGKLVSSSSIIVTASLTNASVKQWQYKNASGSWVAYPNTSTTSTLTVKDTDAVFVNDVALIKIVTDDSSVFDIHQITKLRDGAAGKDTYTCILSNDTQSIPCTSDGALYGTSLNGCDTKITIYKGGDDDTTNWTITASPSSGVTGTYDSKTYTYKVTGITVDSGYVEFSCVKSGTSTITKRFSMNKDRAGAIGSDAVIYQLNTDVSIMKLNASNVFTPSSATFSATKTIGNGDASAYSGRFKIYETLDNSTYTLKYTSSSDQSSKIYTPSSANVKAIKAELYLSGGTTTLKDTQTLSVVSDGKKGDKGDAGKDSVNVILGNSSEVIPCNTDGKSSTAKDITIPYSCYKGTVRIAGSATVGTLPSGVTVKSNTNATASTDGSIVLAVASGATLSSSQSGDITITVTANDLTSTHKFTWTKSIKALDGKSAVLFQIYAPAGDVIVNGKNNVELMTTIMSGSSTITSGVTYQWAKYVGGKYTNITSATRNSLTVTPDMVDSVAPFRCTATYNNVSYVAYWCVTDKTDDVDLEIYCSFGDKLLNGVGVGGAYAITYQKGVEIDPIKSTTFSETAPAKPATGDFYYKIDKTQRTVTLMKYSGTAWVVAPDADMPKGTYTWTRRDKNGTPLDENGAYATGKAIFVDKDVVNKKITVCCNFKMNQ